MTFTRLATFIVFAGMLAAASGCALFERGYERLYQTLDAREQLTRQSSPATGATGSAMSYSQYQTERRRLLDRKPAK